MMWHRHQWVETERSFTPPVGAMNASGISSHALERLLWGITSIVLTCSCGDKKVIEVKGRTVAP
jgi:hypothetical protein